MAAGRPRDPDVDARILAATRALLVEGGLASLNLTEVARRAEVGRPTIYRRYPNTEALAMAVLEADLAERFAALKEVPLDDRSPEDLLVAIGTHFFTYYAEDVALSRAMLQLSLFAPPPWAARFAAQVWGFLVWVTEALEARKRAGLLLDDVDCGLLAQAFYGLYLTIVIGGTSGLLDLPTQQAMLPVVLQHHLRGLVPSSPTRR